MLAGGISVIAWKYLLAPLGGFFAIYELLPCFFISLGVMVLVSKLTPEPDATIYAEFDHYMDDDVEYEQEKLPSLA